MSKLILLFVLICGLAGCGIIRYDPPNYAAIQAYDK